MCTNEITRGALVIKRSVSAKSYELQYNIALLGSNVDDLFLSHTNTFNEHVHLGVKDHVQQLFWFLTYSWLT